MSAEQLVLDLPHRPALGRDDFLVAAANEAAVAWLDRWPEWPGGGLALHGPRGCGKSHLGAVWRARCGAAEIAPEELAGAAARVADGDLRACVVDRADERVAGDAARERHLLHLYNRLREARGHLLLTARTPPARWPLALADLRSRLAALAAVAIGPPDDELLGAVLVKLLADRQLRVGRDVLLYLLPRLERSFAAARDVVQRIDARALAGRRNITVPLVREVLRGRGRDT